MGEDSVVVVRMSTVACDARSDAPSASTTPVVAQLAPTVPCHAATVSLLAATLQRVPRSAAAAGRRRGASHSARRPTSRCAFHDHEGLAQRARLLSSGGLGAGASETNSWGGLRSDPRSHAWPAPVRQRRRRWRTACFTPLEDRFTSGEKPGSSRGAAAASSMAPGEEAEGTGRIGVKNRSAPRSPKIGPPTSSGRVPRNFYPLVKTTSAVSPTSSARVPKNFPPGVKTTGEVRTGVQERTMVCTSEWLVLHSSKVMPSELLEANIWGGM
ncbi:hypothetical protein ZWY2020_005633 [Hordeum vulgare]|nr:hypothetical protein ZWY2020_005633 [Hordeum vulgare]